jgi:hypothetical protein
MPRKRGDFRSDGLSINRIETIPTLKHQKQLQMLSVGGYNQKI